MTPAQLSRTVLHTVRRLVEDGELGVATRAVPERVVVEAPPRRGDGDYAVPLSFELARLSGGRPRDVAELLAERLRGVQGVAGAAVTGGGHLNVTLDDRARAALVAELARPARQADLRDAPAADIAAWSRATGDDPRALAVRTVAASPLFLVQYAHARARALVRAGAQLGVRGDGERSAARPGRGDARPHPYGPRARRLLALLADHERVAAQGVPARQARHLEAVAGALLDVHDHCPVLPRGDEKPGAAHRALLALAEAAGTVLAGGLTQLGVTAPAHI